jgi:P-type conjugative transfer protein TrbJ
MTRNRFRISASRLALVLALSLTPLGSSRAQIVFDPSNYAQNVMTAANTLQQINNQIMSLQNEATMIMNQARNLASLPYSSLQTIDRKSVV